MLTIFPYCENDGVRTLSDTAVGDLYDRLACEGLARWAFFDGSVRDRSDFLRVMKSGANRLFLVLKDGVPKAIFWLNHIEGRSCWIHFAVFREAHGPLARDMGRFVTTWLLTCKDREGSPLFDAVVGVIPRRNRLARRFAMDVGMEKAGFVPSMLYDAYEGASTGACLYCMTLDGRE